MWWNLIQTHRGADGPWREMCRIKKLFNGLIHGRTEEQSISHMRGHWFTLGKWFFFHLFSFCYTKPWLEITMPSDIKISLWISFRYCHGVSVSNFITYNIEAIKISSTTSWCHCVFDNTHREKQHTSHVTLVTRRGPIIREDTIICCFSRRLPRLYLGPLKRETSDTQNTARSQFWPFYMCDGEGVNDGMLLGSKIVTSFYLSWVKSLKR